MLSIGKLPSASNTAVCYLEVIANGRDDYYLAAGEAPGRWMGSAAAHLGLGGSVTPEDLRAMLGGLHPRSGEKLVGWRTVAGFDLTLSAPKSVSLLWALGGEEVATQVMAAHDAAVEAAVSYFQDAACLVRRGGVPARTSRESDPNLHTHLVTGNLTLGEDGRWSALHSADLYRHGRTTGLSTSRCSATTIWYVNSFTPPAVARRPDEPASQASSSPTSTGRAPLEHLGDGLGAARLVEHGDQRILPRGRDGDDQAEELVPDAVGHHVGGHDVALVEPERGHSRHPEAAVLVLAARWASPRSLAYQAAVLRSVGRWEESQDRRSAPMGESVERSVSGVRRATVGCEPVP